MMRIPNDNSGLNKPFNKPNLFILGAGKSGTTTLYEYLCLHPKIFMSRIKEPTFFCEDFQVVKNPVEYFELFDEVKDETYIGEASHGYLSDPKVSRIISALFPKSKFILIFRNPAERAYSLYHHMKRNGLEKINTFEKALVEENLRINSEFFRKNNPQYFHNYLYFSSGKYGEQIQRYLSFFDRSNFLFLKYEDLLENPDRVLNDIWNFLGIEAINNLSHIHSNKGFNVKSILLDKVLNSRLIDNRFYNLTGLKKTLKNFNNDSIKPMNPDTKENLMLRYKEDLDLLNKLTGIKF